MRGSSTSDHWWQQYGYTPLPSDALVLLVLVVLVDGLYYSQALDSVVLRALVGLPFLFLAPGYALVALLFPGRELAAAVTPGTGERGSLSAVRGSYLGTRLALSLGASLAILPLLALVLSGLGFEYSVEVVVTSLTAFVVVTTLLAVVRRTRLPADERFRLPVREWIHAADRAVLGNRSTLDTVLNVALAAVVLASVAGVGYAVVAPSDGQSYTSVSLLTENESTGDLVTADYPDEFDPAGEELVLQIANHEGESTTYTAVGELQAVSTTETSLTVESRSEQLRTTETVAAGSEVTLDHTVEPSTSGEDLRLIYYVYQGEEAPEEPTEQSAYRTVHVWVDVPSEP